MVAIFLTTIVNLTLGAYTPKISILAFKTYYYDTTKSIDLILIGHEVRRTMIESNAEEGLVTLSLPSTGAGFAIFESDFKPEDIKKSLEPFRDNKLLQCFLPKTLSLTFEKTNLTIQPWQNVYLIDYENTARRREIRLQLFSQSKEANEPKP